MLISIGWGLAINCFICITRLVQITMTVSMTVSMTVGRMTTVTGITVRIGGQRYGSMMRHRVRSVRRVAQRGRIMVHGSRRMDDGNMRMGHLIQ